MSTIGRLGALLLVGWLLSSAPALAGDAGSSRVRDDIERFVRAGAPAGEVSVEIPRLASFGVDASRIDAPLRTEIRTRAPRPFAGHVPVTVALYSGDRLLHRGTVSPYVRVAGRVVVPSRDLRRGEILTAADVELQEWDRRRIAANTVVSKEQAIGLRVRRSLRRGRPFRTSDVESVPVVERGDRVTLLLENGPLRIQTLGRARESGAIGDWIRVENLDSRKEISGRVDREGVVRVAF